MTKKEYLGIQIDLSKDKLFDKLGIQRLQESYMKEDETSPQERFAFVSTRFASNFEHAQRLYNYASDHWLSYSTPILSFGRSKKGMPISCFLNYIDDTAEGLVNNLSETNWLSMLGGGVGIGFGIRSTDDKSVGVMPHLKTYDASCLAYRQGRTRRGSYATYLDINHPDIVMFLEMRKPTGDQNVRCLNLHHGVNISDRFMELIERCMSDPTADDGWNLCDPHSGEIRETVSAKELWQKILELRMETGEPYIHYIDTSNKHLPEFQKKLGLKIHQSNLCLTGDTVIQIKESEHDEPQFIALDEFVEKFALGYFTSPYVESHVDGEIVWASVSNAAQTGTTDDLYEIESPNGKIIRCTPEHKIYTKNRGYVMSKDLVETDELLEL